MKKLLGFCLFILFTHNVSAQDCPIQQVWNYYHTLNDKEAQRTITMYNGVQELLERGYVNPTPNYFIAQQLMQIIASKGIESQLAFNSARDAEDKLRATADSASLLRLWPQVQEILKTILQSASPPKSVHLKDAVLPPIRP